MTSLELCFNPCLKVWTPVQLNISWGMVRFSCYMSYSIMRHECFKLPTGEWGAIISNYCAKYSMGCKDNYQFLNGFSGSNGMLKMDIDPFRMCINQNQKHVTNKWARIIKMNMARKATKARARLTRVKHVFTILDLFVLQSCSAFCHIFRDYSVASLSLCKLWSRWR